MVGRSVSRIVRYSSAATATGTGESSRFLTSDGTVWRPLEFGEQNSQPGTGERRGVQIGEYIREVT